MDARRPLHRRWAPELATEVALHSPSALDLLRTDFWHSPSGSDAFSANFFADTYFSTLSFPNSAGTKDLTLLFQMAQGLLDLPRPWRGGKRKAYVVGLPSGRYPFKIFFGSGNSSSFKATWLHKSVPSNL